MKKVNAMLKKCASEISEFYDDKNKTDAKVNKIQKDFWKKHKKAAIVFDVVAIAALAIEVGMIIKSATEEKLENDAEKVLEVFEENDYNLFK